MNIFTTSSKTCSFKTFGKIDETQVLTIESFVETCRGIKKPFSVPTNERKKESLCLRCNGLESTFTFVGRRRRARNVIAMKKEGGEGGELFK